MDDRQEQLNNLALDVLKLSRNTLLVNLRFLDMALSQFTYRGVEDNTLLTDGKYLLYDPRHILRCYKDAKEIPVRDYLHIVMHCVYRHMFADPTLNRVYWDLACDIAVENVITELKLKAVTAARERQQASYIEAIKKELGMVTAEKIYAYLRTAFPDPNTVAQIRGLFYADNHEIWYMTGKEKSETYGLPQSGDGQDENEEEDPGAALAAAWQAISQRMQTDILMFSNGRYGEAGNLVQNLKEVNRERYDYTAFLKKFAVMGEAMKINDDEFDYIFYTYGLQTYGNLPLIEPLEYKEVKRIKEFVIAIDTSGSVIGDLVQQFVQKTYNILKSTESFFSKINLHIIQCDTAIQEHVKVTNQEEFDRYLKTMTLKGFGGNNEIGLFSYVDDLIKHKEFTNLKGMIYLTDGYGIFPKKKPDYDVAFVFVNDRYEIPEVPPWVIRLVLQKDDI